AWTAYEFNADFSCAEIAIGKHIVMRSVTFGSASNHYAFDDERVGAVEKRAMVYPVPFPAVPLHDSPHSSPPRRTDPDAHCRST
nr:hypothetical protein [Tanacetum cinerariifolium]